MSKKILIVDDATFVRVRLGNSVKKIGYEPVFAENGKVAIEQYVKEKPDVVFMDISMPVMDGISSLKEIIKADPQARIIMLTNEAQQKTIIEALQCGAKMYLVKPFDDNVIAQSVNEVLSK
ncbi:MAG: response regulator [Candidatus Margulisbacteria bacterium]|nr:response regulator [Candidatus Margulisiibacteriota bacterium]